MRKPTAIVFSLLLLLLPATAAASPGALIRDCLRNGKITGSYSQQDYAQALANLPTDVAEYSDCADVIRRAQLAAAAGGPGAASALASLRFNPLTTATPAELAKVVSAGSAGGGAQRLPDGGLVHPGVVAVRTGSIVNALPAPLQLSLGSLALIALTALGLRLRNRLRTRGED